MSKVRMSDIDTIGKENRILANVTEWMKEDGFDNKYGWSNSHSRYADFVGSNDNSLTVSLWVSLNPSSNNIVISGWFINNQFEWIHISEKEWCKEAFLQSMHKTFDKFVEIHKI